MRVERPKKYVAFEWRHSPFYGDMKKLSVTAYFEGISARNRCSNELFGLDDPFVFDAL